MKVSEIYPSRFFRVADITGRTVRLTIERVSTSQFRDSKEKLALHFVEDPKSLTLNPTNAWYLGDALGDEANAWKGALVELYVEPVKFENQFVDSILVRVSKSNPPVPGEPSAPPTVHAKAAPAGSAGGLATMEDDIPF